MSRVAFFIYGIGNLKGGGGAERFFADFFDRYSVSGTKIFDLYYIIDDSSVRQLNAVGKLKTRKGLKHFKIISNRFKDFLEALQLYRIIIFNRIEIIHVPLYNNTYVPLLKYINKLPGIFRPRLAINIVNCYAAPALADQSNKYHTAMKATYLPLFESVKVDGYFCWNTNFQNYLREKAKLKNKPSYIQSITSRFSDTESYRPEKKEKWIVFASRLDEQKHPEWMLEAIKGIKENDPSSLGEWKFKVCGNGPMRDQLIEYSQKNELSEYVDFIIEGEMHNVLNRSMIYVSCQDYDNFPSLTMSEAMSAGNAIVARNVGQTELFVSNNVNGLLISPDSPLGLEEALNKLMKNETLISTMTEQSIQMIKTVHNYANFEKQIEEFWRKLR